MNVDTYPAELLLGRKSNRNFIAVCVSGPEVKLHGLRYSGNGELGSDEFVETLQAKSIFPLLVNLKKLRGTTWVVGWSMQRFLEKIKFWDLLAMRKVHLPGTVQVYHGGKGMVSKTRLSGSFVSRPGHVDIEFVAGGNKFRVVDLANWNIEDIDESGDNLIPLIDRTVAAVKNLVSIVTTHQMGALKTTCSQQGWTCYRTHHADGSLRGCADISLRELERASHYPGRNEPYKLGPVEGVTHSIDIKSCYPWICAEWPMPARAEHVFSACAPQALPIRSSGEQCTATVILDTPLPDYPVQWGSQVIYPTGKFVTTLAWPELAHALRAGVVKTVLGGVIYKSSPLLKKYAEWFVATKKILAEEKNLQGLQFLKAAFNGSLGYASRHGYSWIEEENHTNFRWQYGCCNHPVTGHEPTHYRIVDGIQSYLDRSGEPAESFPAIHAHICSAARVALLHVFFIVGRENVLYCDTDGLLVNQAGYDRVKIHPRWGGAEPGAICSKMDSGPAEIWARKLYRVGDSIVAAGVPLWEKLKKRYTVTNTTPWGRLLPDNTVVPWRSRLEYLTDSSEIPTNDFY
jgi:hypothetical protein